MADERFINVFLDTQFFDSNQMDFASKTFEVLRLAAQAALRLAGMRISSSGMPSAWLATRNTRSGRRPSVADDP